MAIAVIIATAAAVAVLAQPAPELATTMVGIHNAQRAEVGSPPMSRDEGVARDTAAWAATLAAAATLRHADQEGEGENL